MVFDFFVSLFSRVIEISRYLPQVSRSSSVYVVQLGCYAAFFDSHPPVRAFEGDSEGRTETVACFCWIFREFQS